jgi:hypothetical protein
MSEVFDIEAALTEAAEGNGDILELLKSGTPTIGATQSSDHQQISIYISPDDSEEVKDAKDNIQFVVNNAREAATFLMSLAKQTGNPRFFESVNSFLNTINGATDKLINLHRRKTEGNDPPAGTNINGNIQNNITNVTQVMSTKDALSGVDASSFSKSFDLPAPAKQIEASSK